MDWDESFGIWPKWGIMLDGECWEEAISEHGISVRESGWWLPTIGKNEFKGASRVRFRGSEEFRGAKMSEGLRICAEDPQYTTPDFAEEAMGWPITWTASAPLGMDKFQQWQASHGNF